MTLLTLLQSSTGGPLRRKWNPGCPCCDCIDCSVYTAGPFTSLTGYTTIDGTWAVTSNIVYASAAPATLIGDIEAPSANMQVTGGLRISTGRSGVVLSWKDSSNYLYAWFQKDGVFGPFSIGITEVIGGVTTDLATDTTDSAANGICAVHYNGTFLARFGRIGPGGPFYHWLEGTVSDASALGKKAGVKTDHTLNSGTEGVTGWTVNQSGPYCENCYCNVVQFGTWVDQLYFDVQGVACDYYETEADGYYVIDYDGSDDDTQPQRCAYQAIIATRGLYMALTYVSDSVVRLTVTITTTSGNVCSATVDLPATCGFIDAATVFATPIVLPLDFVTIDECDWSNATATIGAA